MDRTVVTVDLGTEGVLSVPVGTQPVTGFLEVRVPRFLEAYIDKRLCLPDWQAGERRGYLLVQTELRSVHQVLQMAGQNYARGLTAGQVLA